MRLHVVVHGRVQGVGFRWFVREVARSRDLAGWVKNLPDGGVEIIADGSAEDVEFLRSQLQIGPRGASVTTLDEVHAGELAVVSRPFAIQR